MWWIYFASIVASLISGLCTTWFVTYLIDSYRKKEVGHRRKRIEFILILIIMVAITLLAIRNTILYGDDRVEHYYPEQWEPAM